MQFALMDGGSLVVVQEFHRVFYGQDMVGLFFVDLVQDCCKCRGLAGARWTGHQHDAVAEVAISPRWAGSFRVSKSGIVVGITRITMA